MEPEQCIIIERICNVFLRGLIWQDNDLELCFYESIEADMYAGSHSQWLQLD